MYKVKIFMIVIILFINVIIASNLVFSTLILNKYLFSVYIPFSSILMRNTVAIDQKALEPKDAHGRTYNSATDVHTVSVCRCALAH